MARVKPKGTYRCTGCESETVVEFDTWNKPKIIDIDCGICCTISMYRLVDYADSRQVYDDYKYICTECGNVHEVNQLRKDATTILSHDCECGNTEHVYLNERIFPPTIDPVSAGRVRINNDFKDYLGQMKKFYKVDINEHGIG